MTPTNNPMRLMTVYADLPFLSDLRGIFQIPMQQYENAWAWHYMSFEICRPLNSVDYCNVRIYTKQLLDPRLPLVKDIGTLVTSKHYQTMTPIYEFSADESTLNKLTARVEQQEKITKMPSNVVQNIDPLQQKYIQDLYNTRIQFTKLIKHEEKIDSMAQTTTLENTGKLLNTKYPISPRAFFEKEIMYYDNTNYIDPKNTYDFINKHTLDYVNVFLILICQYI